MMKTAVKAAFWLLVLAGAAGFHERARRRRGLSWKDYGKRQLLGPEGGGRVPAYDFLRALTACLVLLYHSAAMANGKLEGGSVLNAVILPAVVILSYSCNMLFVVLSGALILPWKEESFGQFYARRFSRVAIPLVLYYLFYLRRTGGLVLSPASLWAAAGTILRGPDSWTPHFWLAYTILGLYLAAPFLRYALKQMPEKALKGTGLLILGGASVKTMLAFLGWKAGVDSFLFGWAGVFVLGYLAVQPFMDKEERRLRAAGIASAVILTALFYWRPQMGAQLAFESPFMMLFACALLRAARRRRRENGVLVRILSRYSYSVLLIHWYVMFIWGEGTLGLTPFLWGEEMALAGILVQAAVSLAFSLLFAIAFDQAVAAPVQSLFYKRNSD